MPGTAEQDRSLVLLFNLIVTLAASQGQVEDMKSVAELHNVSVQRLEAELRAKSTDLQNCKTLIAELQSSRRHRKLASLLMPMPTTMIKW